MPAGSTSNLRRLFLQLYTRVRTVQPHRAGYRQRTVPEAQRGQGGGAQGLPDRTPHPAPPPSARNRGSRAVACPRPHGGAGRGLGLGPPDSLPSCSYLRTGCSSRWPPGWGLVPGHSPGGRPGKRACRLEELLQKRLLLLGPSLCASVSQKMSHQDPLREAGPSGRGAGGQPGRPPAAPLGGQVDPADVELGGEGPGLLVEEEGLLAVQ